MHAMTISNPPLLPPSTINSDSISSPKVQITSSSQLKLTMELQFQQQQCQYQAPATGAATTTTSKAASKGMARSKCKFVGVRQRPSGRWVAEIKDTTHKIRVWLGTFETAEEAARAYDEAACLLRGSNTRTNFATTTQYGASSSPAPQPDSPLVSRIRTLLTHKKLKKSAAPPPPSSPQQPTIAFTPTTTTHRRHASAIATTTSKVSASSSSSSSTSSSISFSMSGSAGLSNQRVADEIYRAYDLINHGSEELRLTTQQFDHQPWAAALNDTIAPLAGGCDMATAGSPHCPTIAAELDAMKMENQEDSTSASPSGGMSGVVQEQDGFDIGSDPCDSLWDLPPICQLSCRSLMY